MDMYFKYYAIPKEEKLEYCLEQLVGNESLWWNQEDKVRRMSLKTWGQLKLLMRERYAPQMLSQPSQNTYPSKEPSQEKTTHQRVSSNQNSAKVSGKNIELNFYQQLEHMMHLLSSKRYEKGTSAKEKSDPTPSLEPQDKPERGKSSNSSKSNESTCYRCHKRGHFAATCPERQVEDVTFLELKLNVSSSNDSLSTSSLEIPNSRLMRLPLPKVIDAGQFHSMDDRTKEVDYKVLTSKLDDVDTSLEEELLETTSTQVCRNKVYYQETPKACVKVQPCSTPSDPASKITLIGADLMPSTLHGTLCQARYRYHRRV
ncbi:PREDICTED: uncharacterized protein LOC104706893 [Camelina sativa]|uniref:Uncharacterized protein LOC104706893 n=1 Tax=Camelina sativa TaxID=90675 RepID=A0ABM0T646_CAMSA|nr:PREDICTED: uncharacterized protein LOC104706893 [Camelina sativa]